MTVWLAVIVNMLSWIIGGVLFAIQVERARYWQKKYEELHMSYYDRMIEAMEEERSTTPVLKGGACSSNSTDQELR